MSTITQYSPIARILHWIIAGLIISQYVIAELAEDAEHADKVFEELALMLSHKSIGMTIFMLAVLRLLWRLFNKPPALPATMPAWQHRAAAITHWSLYGLIFFIPLSGWLMSSASEHSVSWFNLFMFPDLIVPSESLADVFHEVHEVLGKLLMVIAIVHIAAALKHHFKDKDDVLARMASLSGWLLLIASIAIALGVFGRVSPAPKVTPATLEERAARVNAIEVTTENTINKVVAASATEQQAVTTTVVEDQLAGNQAVNENVEESAEEVEKLEKLKEGSPVTALPLWNIDYAASHIKFSGDQSGTPFEGRWQRWHGEMRFHPEHLELSRFEVSIETNSVLSDDTERDQYIVDEDFFDAPKHPQVRFLADQFSVVESGDIEAKGSLTMKGLSNPAVLSFKVDKNDHQLILTGTSTLDRFDWNIGMGDWTDISWVGKDVGVSVRVVARL